MPPDRLLERSVHERVVVDLRHDAGADVRGLAHRHARAIAPLIGEREVAAVVDAVVARVRGLGPLETFLADPTVSDVIINAGRDVWVERAGVLEQIPITLTTAEAEIIIERVVGPLGRRIDRASPMVDARLPDGSRVHAVVSPIAVDGPCLTIRRFAIRPVPLESFGPQGVFELLVAAVASRANIVVSGGTGSGKTTLLNALGAHIDERERIVTIEDAAELRLPCPHVVRLEARPPSADGVGEVTIRELVRAALRMRPDRIVVGEVRGAEALDLVAAMNTGHDGCLSTCHANGPLEALRRLETLVLLADSGLPLAAVRHQLAASVDLIVHVARSSRGAERDVVAVGEVSPDGRGVRTLVDRGCVLAAPVRTR
ncbi:MAG: CpaF family protein [Acidimicrobiales bacterium]